MKPKSTGPLICKGKKETVLSTLEKIAKDNPGITLQEYVNRFGIDYYIVTRAYQTRHGNGPMTNEDKRHNIIENPDETNIDRKWQGQFRRTLLDLDLISYAIEKDPGIRASMSKTLVITCLDHIKLDYRFTHAGQIFVSSSQEEFLNKISNILGIYQLLINDSPDSKTFKKLML